MRIMLWIVGSVSIGALVLCGLCLLQRVYRSVKLDRAVFALAPTCEQRRDLIARLVKSQYDTLADRQTLRLIVKHGYHLDDCPANDDYEATCECGLAAAIALCNPRVIDR